MMGVSKLVYLRVLNLPHNSIGYVEGLKDLVHLEWLNLAGNNLKAIDQINNCTSLQHLDLSDNNISQIGDLSKLSCLKTFLLHGNNITSLRTASTSLPQNLSILSLAENEIRDLNEVSFLAGLADLEQLSIMNNPCVMATPSIPGFDYRPYIVSWCLNLKVLDGYIVSQKESLKAEWLYSQGKGRSYRPGQHVPLVQYLASVCPLTSAQGLQTDEDAKLEKILSKQRLHQRQLMHQIFSETHLSSTPNKRSYTSAEQQSPTRLLHRPSSEPFVKVDTWLGTSNSEDHSYASRNASSSPGQSGLSYYNNLYLEDIQTDEDKLNSSLLSSESTFMPVALGLSPDSPTVELRVPGITGELSANNTGTGMSKGISENIVKHEKVKAAEAGTTVGSCTSRVKSPERLEQRDNSQSSCDSVMECSQQYSSSSSHSDEVLPLQNKDTDHLSCMNKAATKLQSCWRGFYARKYNPKVKEVHYEIRLSRMQEHIVFLSHQVCRLKKDRDEERMQRLVQEQALQYLWNQVRSLQEWQNTVSGQIDSVPRSDVCRSEALAEQPSSKESAPETASRKTTPDIPDSGFHSIDIGQMSHQEMGGSEKSSTEESASSEKSLETVKQYQQPLPDFIEDHEATAQDHSESSKDDSSLEQDSSLLQQYLQKVEQLEEAEDNTSLSDVTEPSRPEIVNSSVNSDVLSSSFSHDCEDGKKEELGTPEDICQSSDDAQGLLASQETSTEAAGELLQS
ncbi:hypothetical protein GDO78_000737 [Eleutherodactylus coqui]|uniref:Centrosomal protein of 97 kDa n=1 Tax=Eleutherodactylus coqui TaxID=57060 RepID=A0A8J6KFX6_ELECQ|nr:hypothetical protein GDO78_000737 [Eleutherodactylus coqui]KAG9492394.1 hypothetical protein GDO78_000737 [Eleutherodactylus coqui]